MAFLRHEYRSHKPELPTSFLLSSDATVNRQGHARGIPSTQKLMHHDPFILLLPLNFSFFSRHIQLNPTESNWCFSSHFDPLWTSPWLPGPHGAALPRLRRQPHQGGRPGAVPAARRGRHALRCGVARKMMANYRAIGCHGASYLVEWLNYVDFVGFWSPFQVGRGTVNQQYCKYARLNKKNGNWPRDGSYMGVLCNIWGYLSRLQGGFESKPWNIQLPVGIFGDEPYPSGLRNGQAKLGTNQTEN